MFGRDNSGQLQQISDQLTQALAELAALRQQVDSQQHAIDRNEATARDHLNDTREVVRRALSETRETLIGQLAAFSSDLATIRTNTQRFEAPATAEQAASPHGEQQAGELQDAPVTSDQSELLRSAAGISHATLKAHRDTWAFLVEHASQDRHFRIPGEVEDHDGAVSVRISGPSLVAAITSLDTASRTASDPGTRAIAGHLHQRLTDTVQAVIDNPHRGDGADAVVIVIDDRAAMADVHEGRPPID